MAERSKPLYDCAANINDIPSTHHNDCAISRWHCSSEPTNADAELGRDNFVRLADPIKHHLMSHGLDELKAGMEAADILLSQQAAIQAYTAKAVAEAQRQELEPLAKLTENYEGKAQLLANLVSKIYGRLNELTPPEPHNEETK